ncbi:MAG: hypothetical protein GF372_10075 [Candidatus Marinimicrobia bacterium]|nr:hypothetical protein [Candidatus Neomarinimicrobiota bacterium]
MPNQIFKINKYILITWLIIAIVVLPVPGITTISVVQAQDDCTEQLNQAEQFYNTGRFDDAEQIIENCLENGTMDREQKLRAYRLLGLTYIAKDLEAEARDTVSKLLEMVPNYQTDPVQDPPPFRNLVDEVKKDQDTQEQAETEEQQTVTEQPQQGDELENLVEQREDRKKQKRKWYYIAGGAVVGAAVITAVVLGGGSDGAEFPMPPGRP